MNGRLDRIVFTHDRSLDFVATASSLPTPDGDRWQEVLRGHVLVSHERRPATSMWYWHNGQDAAVLWRMTTPGDGRADRCHALVGSVDVLDTAMAMALVEWPGWRDEQWTPGPDGRLSPADAITSHRQDEPAPDGDLVTVVRSFLMCPGEPMSIVTDAVDSASTVRLLRDVVNVAGTMFGAERRWTFSTFETRHDESVRRLPHVVVLPADHEESRSHPVRRTVVRLPARGILADDHYQRLAEVLVARYRRGGAEQLANWLDTLGVFLAANPKARVERLHAGISSPASAATPQVQPRLSTDVELLDRLGTVPSGSVTDLLAEIQRRRIAGDAERDKVRCLMLAGSPWLERVHAALGEDDADHAVDTVVGYAIHPRDWRDDRVLADVNDVIANPTTARRLEVALVRNAIGHRAWPSLTLGLAIRHVRDMGFDVPAGEHEPQPDSRPRTRIHAVPTAVWIAVVLLMLVVMVVVVA